jgi:hypothetical protein
MASAKANQVKMLVTFIALNYEKEVIIKVFF